MFALSGGRFISYYWCYEHKTTTVLTYPPPVLPHKISTSFPLLLSKFLMNYALRINTSQPLIYHGSDILTYGLAVF